jgi:hypothetical protein
MSNTIFWHDRDAPVQMISDKQRSDMRKNNLSGPLSLPTRASANSYSAPIRSSGGISTYLLITAIFLLFSLMYIETCVSNLHCCRMAAYFMCLLFIRGIAFEN